MQMRMLTSNWYRKFDISQKKVIFTGHLFLLAQKFDY
jgi:hypothetical protein